jgi:hypothetical protein
MARILILTALCDRCAAPTPVSDLEPRDDDEGRWCIDCHAEHANWEYRREPEINPDR